MVEKFTQKRIFEKIQRRVLEREKIHEQEHRTFRSIKEAHEILITFKSRP